MSQQPRPTTTRAWVSRQKLPNSLAGPAAIAGGLALVTSMFIVGGAIGLIAVGLGIAALLRSRTTDSGRGLAIGAIVLGIVAIVIAGTVAYFYESTGAKDAVECRSNADTQSARQKCVDDWKEKMNID